MPENIKVLIVDDHPVVRSGLSTMISSEEGMEVVGVACNGVEGVEKAFALNPDVILMDLVMPRKDGVEAITDIKDKNPDAKILVLTSYSDDSKIIHSIQAGATGYILKDSSPDELLEAVRQVDKKQPFMQPQILAKLMEGLKHQPEEPDYRARLTEREVEILKLVSRGNTNQDIALFLSISERTVTKHVSNILDKLQLSNRTQIAFYAAQEGLLDIDN